MKDDITQITEFLKGVDKPSLNRGRKALIRAHLVEQMSVSSHESISCGEAKLGNYIKTVADPPRISAYTRSLMRERILMYIGGVKQRRYLFSGAGAFGKRFVGAFLVVLMFMGFFSFVTVDVNVAMADSFTVIESLKGRVTVERDGEMHDAFDEMELQEGDVVLTGDDGWVSIKFFDDSVSRLRAGTSIHIRKLFEDPGDLSITNVEIEVSRGEMWTRVLNLLEDDSSFVVTAGDILASAKKAAFNVHKDERQAVVEVYSNAVEMKASSGDEKKTIVSGQKVVSKPKVVSISSSSSTNVDDDDWVQENMENDKVHIAQVEEGKSGVLEDSVGAMPGSTLYPMKSLKDGVKKLFTFDDISDQKIDLEATERKFVEWSAMLKDGEVEQADAEKVFEEFVVEVGEFRNLIVEVRESGDDEYADELKNYLVKKLKERKRVLKTVLPDSALYTAKEYLLKAEIASAETDADRALAMKHQATLKLSEAQDLTEAGEGQLASDTMDEYAEAVGEIDEEVGALSEEDQTMLSSVEEMIVDVGLEEEVVVAPVVSVPAPVVVPVQRTADYGVPVSGEKPLDPLLDLSR